MAVLSKALYLKQTKRGLLKKKNSQDKNVQSKDSIKDIINKKGCRKGGKSLTLTVPFGPSTGT